MGQPVVSPLNSVAPEAVDAERGAIINQNAQLQNLVNNGSPLAQAQMQQATNQNMSNSAGIIASAKGINPAMAARTAAYSNAGMGQAAANQSAQTTAQTQLGAQQQISNNQMNQYSTDVDANNKYNALSTQNNQFNEATSQANTKMGLSFMGSLIGAAAGAADGGLVPDSYAKGGQVVERFEGGGMAGMMGGMGGGGMAGMMGGMGGGGDSGGKIPDPKPIVDGIMKGASDPAPGILNGPKPQVQQAPTDSYSAISSFFQSLDQNSTSSPNSVTGQMMQSSSPTSNVPAPSTASILGKTPNSLMGAIADDVTYNHVKAPDTSTDMTQAPQSSLNPDQIDSGMAYQYARGGRVRKVPALVSPGETYLKPAQAKAVAKGKVNPLKVGERIPGVPKVAGNSYVNDVVPKKLDAGGIVIPNSVMQSSDPARNAYKFVQAVMAQQRAKGKKK